MTSVSVPKLTKWPFYLADAFLLGVAALILYKCPDPFQFWPLLSLVTCSALGAWVSITPFLRQYNAEVKFAESNSLTSTVEQLNNLRTFTNQISFATAQWQIVQEQSSKTVGAAKDISERMAIEAKAFSDFIQKANDNEKSHLRLEIEKLRRGENEWLHVLVRTLDHVYALYMAGIHSGQPNLMEQLTHFQNACRDAARRVGLIPFEAKPNEPYDEKTHQLADPQAQPYDGALVRETIATGFSFQGQMIRPAIVILHASQTPTAPAETLMTSSTPEGFIAVAPEPPRTPEFYPEPEPEPATAAAARPGSETPAASVPIPAGEPAAIPAKKAISETPSLFGD